MTAVGGLVLVLVLWLWLAAVEPAVAAAVSCYLIAVGGDGGRCDGGAGGRGGECLVPCVLVGACRIVSVKASDINHMLE